MAEDVSNENQKYVVKLLKPKQNSNREDFEERKRLFKREAEHLNKLEHSQIPKLKDYFVINYRLLLMRQLDKQMNKRKLNFLAMINLNQIIVL